MGLFLNSLNSQAFALTDFVTDNPKLIITTDEKRLSELDETAREKTANAKELIQGYFKDWQSQFGRIKRNLKINLIPVEREIDTQGGRAEGVWSWDSFDNEKGAGTLGIVGNLYVNLNSVAISQEALVAHEASHAFLLTYYPRLLDGGNEYVMYNEGLAELFSIQYEPKPWKGWDKLVIANRFKEGFNLGDLSSYGRRAYNVLTGRARLPHDFGFFFLKVVRKSKVDLDKDLRECNNDLIRREIRGWLQGNSKDMDLPMFHD